MASNSEPPYLPIGTDVSAKYRGAFCEAKVKKIVKSVKCRVFLKETQSSLLITDEFITGSLQMGSTVEVKHPDTGRVMEAIIKQMSDSSMYTVVFDDADERTLRRTQLCLKGDKHFMESETLDNLPLSNPEHFGTPVIARGKRGRTSLGTGSSHEESESSSSEDESPRKKYRGKNQELVGKVMFYENGDRKKTQTLPVLVVLPDAHDTELKNKDHVLIRSFKDGKYLSVARKELNIFVRETILKNEDKALKPAMEKALLYVDNRELPATWKKEEMLGSDDDEEEEEDDMSDDDEISEEKDRFVAQLYKFSDDRGTPINKGPSIGTKDLNLYKLFKVVQKYGGYNRVTNQMKWRLVYSKMQLPPSNTASTQIKNAYKKYLHAFEDFYRKLGSSMGTISRPSRSRNDSGRSILNFRGRESARTPDKKMANNTLEIDRIHRKLLADISDHMIVDGPEYENFTEHLKSYVPKGRLAGKSILDQLDALSTCGHLKSGDYKVLKDVCEASGNIDIVDMIEEAERKNKKVKQESLIPVEILRMDKNSIELYKHALSDRQEAVHAIRVMVVGHFGVGKTTLTKRLFGEEVDIDKRESTNGIDVHVRRCKVAMDTGAWNTSDKDQNVAMACHRLVKLLKSSTFDEKKQEEDTVSMTKEVLKTESKSSSERDEIKEPTTKSLKVESNAKDESSSLKPKEEYFQNYLKILIEEVRHYSTDDDESNTADVSVWDFAGQYAFYATHQVFLSRRAVYLLVTDISKSLEDIVKDDDCFVDSKGAKQWTISEFVHFWLNSIHEFCSTREDEGPPVLLVGTFADKLNQELKKKTIDEFFYNLRKSLLDKPTKCHLIEEDFDMDLSVIDTNIELLRKQIVSTASKQAFWGELIPARWITLENIIIHLKDGGLKVLQKERLRDLNNTLPVEIETQEELELFLRFHHESGNILYFSDTKLSDSIVLEPQWLIDAFKSLITAKMFCSRKSDNIFKKWVQFDESAILTVDLVDAIWAKEENPDFHKHRRLLLDYLEKLGFIAKPIQSSEDAKMADSYFAPSVLKTPPPEDLLSCKDCKNRRFTSKMCFTTASGFLPTAVFNKLLAACLSKWQLLEKNKRGLIFCGSGLFDLNKDNHTLFVFFFDHVIQVWVRRLSTKNLEPDFTLCSEVHDFVFDLLQNRFKLSGIKVFVRCQFSELYSNDNMFAVNEIAEKTEVECDCTSELHQTKDLTKYWSAGAKLQSIKDNVRFPELTQAKQQSHGVFFDTHGQVETMLDSEAKVQASVSVCKLFYPIFGGHGTATAFRVGSRYVMTATHVTNAFLAGKHYAAEKYAVFNYKEYGVINEEDKYWIKDVVYSNPETDISVIELHPNLHKMPPPFTHFSPPVCNRGLHLIGHSQGNPMESNLVNKFYDKNSPDIQNTLSVLQEKSLKHTAGKSFDTEPHDTVLNPKRFLFQCKFTKGASGSPGIVRIEKQMYVTTVLLHGYPDWYHDPKMEGYRVNWSDDQCVQQGVNLMCVREMMQETHPELFDDIFGEQLRQEENLNAFS